MNYYSHAITNDCTKQLSLESYKSYEMLQNFDRVTLLCKRPLGTIA